LATSAPRRRRLFHRSRSPSVIPLAAGGAVDTKCPHHGRVDAGHARPAILVENNGAPAASPASTGFARAAPDGYTISVGTWGTHVVNAFVYSTPYDLAQDSKRWRCCKRAALVHRAEKPAAEGLQGVHRLSEGKQRQGHRRLGRRRRQLGVCGYYFGKATGTSTTLVPYRGAHRRCRIIGRRQRRH